MDEIRVSVVIPVYKAELYIERCARSLMEQTMKTGIEFLFINDCTPDDSMGVLQRVIEEYPDRLPQIRIINHTSNKGIAYTRGEGIREAKGDYIGWCDSDDWCEPTMFEKMYEATKVGKLDMVVCEYYRHTEEEVSIMNTDNPSSPIKYLNSIYRNKHWQRFSVLYSKLIKRSVYIDNQIFPYEGINRSEDLNIMVRVCCFAKSIGVVNKPLYHYNKMNNQSITHTGFSEQNDWNQQSANTDRICEFLSQNKPNEWKVLKAFLQFWLKTEREWTIFTPESIFQKYRNSHWYILRFTSIPLVNRINMFFVYNCRYLYYSR